MLRLCQKEGRDPLRLTPSAFRNTQTCFAALQIGVYCTQSGACRLAAAQRGALQLGRDAVQHYRRDASETARESDDARAAWARDAMYKGWVLCDVILRTDVRDDQAAAAKLPDIARELGLARAAARAIVKGPARAGLHVLAVLEASTRDDAPGALAQVWAKKGLVKALLELLLTAARLVDRPSDDSSSSGEDSDTGAPQSDRRAPQANGRAPYANGRAPHSDAGVAHADTGATHLDGGAGPSDDSALQSDGRAADPDGPKRLPTQELRQLHSWEMRDFWADDAPLWARARAACAQALKLLSRAVEGGAYLEFVRSRGVDIVTRFLARRDFDDERSVARMETMRQSDDPELLWKLRAGECWSEAGGTAEALWGRAAAEAGLKKCPLVAKCRQRESMKGRFQQCGRRCGTFYCSKECQAIDWRAGHKKICIPAAASKPEA
ncbi:hypothetical protein KFL_000920170 [Klebsormidium nitens]|uniref:MYND-type domain-containing protein n=1 Tax=Klebsormidium nitens TaxID=105231 RepID=A0A0U9HJ47_KLENI|nr:hypothetical protein KFL_000920170 [Klebsormidium nitens]|eukprot:GAQ81832.1 hypothetical protein KFL_000920170 [Klebsormidium nitens]